ncbi:MAG TPA: hypothetical protein VE863_22310 [Pyrinomonadaceae bacterium]|nr:hypothetical protein [Pyrinomonadaceae bacterium]
MRLRICFSIAALIAAAATISLAQTPRTPTDVVRDFYKAMHDHRFRDAWAMSVYKPAIDGLSADEMEDLRPLFEQQAAGVPDQVQIDDEKITGNTAQVFVRLPPTDSSPQLTSKPVDLIKSGSAWIIGTESEEATVKKAGGRYFLDALIDINQDAMTDILKRLIGMEAVFAQANNGAFGEAKALVGAGLMSDDMFDPKKSGYVFHLAVSGKTYVASAEPAHYNRTGKLSFWMDQTGAIKSADNGGKPLSDK